MYISKPISLVLITFLFWLTTFNAQADIVHKWVDAEGVTHYSDQLPEEEATKTTRQIIVSNVYSNSGGAAYRENYYSISNQWARMREERIERKQMQLDKRKQKASQHPPPQIVYLNQAQEPPKSVYYPAYPVHPVHLGRYGFRHRLRNNSVHYYPVRNRSDQHVLRSINSYRGSTFKVPRNSYSKRGGLGLSLTFR
jgi:hypothetical protein